MSSKKKREELIKKRVAEKVAAKLAEVRQARTEKREKRIQAAKVKIDKAKAEVKKRASKKATAKNTVTENRLELLFTIVNRSKGEYYADLLQSFDVNMQMSMLGYGTADERTLAAFGLADSDKAVIISVIQGDKLPEALRTLEQKFQTIKNGKGVAYTVPLTSVIGTLIFGFLSNNRKAVKENNK